MIETYQVFDMTRGDIKARSSIGSWSDKLHCLDSEAKAKSRRTRLANLHPTRDYGILKTTVQGNGHAWVEWVGR